jgi:hypothetical protein
MTTFFETEFLSPGKGFGFRRDRLAQSAFAAARRVGRYTIDKAAEQRVNA